MPLFLEKFCDVGEGLEGFQALVDEFFPFSYPAVQGLGAEFCQGDLTLLDSDETEIFRGIDNRKKLVKIDAQVDG